MAEATDSCKMLAKDRSIWSKLPEAPILEILARLPLRSLAQYRAVCKTWNTAIARLWKCGVTLWSTANRAEELPDKFPDKYWFVFFDGICYNPTINRCHQIKFFASHQVEKVLATDGGLMLCAMPSRWANGRSKLSVCNPFKAECCTLLPEHPPGPRNQLNPDRAGFGIVADKGKDSHAFKVVRVPSWDLNKLKVVSPLETQVYDSRSKSWRVIKPRLGFAKGWEVLHSYHRRGVCYENHLLFISQGDHTDLTTYNLKAETWHTIALPDRSHGSNPIALSDLQYIAGRLFVIRVYSLDLQLLEFRKTSNEPDDLGGTWSEVSIGSRIGMPSRDLLLPECYDGSADAIEPLRTWQGALPNFLKSGSEKTPVLITFFWTPINPTLVFNVDENTWYKVDESYVKNWPNECTFHQAIWPNECTFNQAMVFTPQLEACACSS